MADSGQIPGDSSLGVQTPEGILFVLYPAGLPIRACAWAIDSFIQGILSITTLVITAGIPGWAPGPWFAFILIFAIGWFYHTAFEVLGRGQSPGKRFMGIRVVKGDGSPVNPGSSFLRNLLRFADTFMFLYLIAFICILASPGWRRLGDWAADTLVVYTGHARSPGRFTAPALRRPGMPWLAGIPLASAARKLRFEEKQAILSFARRYPLLGRDRAGEIAGIWAGQLRPGGSGPVVAPNAAGILPAEPEAGVSGPDFLLGIARTLSGTP